MKNPDKIKFFLKIKKLRTTALILFGLLGPIIFVSSLFLSNENLTMLLAAILFCLEAGFLIYVVFRKCPHCNNPFYGESASYLLKNECFYCGYPTNEGRKGSSMD